MKKMTKNCLLTQLTKMKLLKCLNQYFDDAEIEIETPKPSKFFNALSGLETLRTY